MPKKKTKVKRVHKKVRKRTHTPQLRKERESIFSYKPMTSHEYFKQIKFHPKISKNQEMDFMVKSIEFNNPNLDEKIIQAFQFIDRAFFVSRK